MDTSKLMHALQSPTNHKAIAIGTAVGAGVVVGAVSLKLLAGAAIAAKVGVSLVAAVSVAKIAHDHSKDGQLAAMFARFESELSSVKDEDYDLHQSTERMLRETSEIKSK